MKLSKKVYQVILQRWETRGINSPSNKLYKSSEAQSNFYHKSESNYFEFVPCPICKEEKYAIFHKKTKFRKYSRNKFMNAIIEVLVSLLGEKKIISEILSFLLCKEVDVFQYQYRVVQCSQCGFLYRNPIYRMKQIKKVYNTNYLKFLTGSYSSEREKMYKNVLERLDFDDRTVDFKRRRLLDIGCGIGLFLNYIRSKEWDTYGLDFAEDCIKYAQREFNLNNVQVGNLNEDTFKESYFDVVTLWSVAAHLENPINMFIKIHKVLRPEGLLLVYTVNAGSLQHKYYLEKWNGFWGNHLVFFDFKSLRRALEKSGFSSVTYVYDNRDFNQWSKDNTISKKDINYFSKLMQKGNMGNMLMVLAKNGI